MVTHEIAVQAFGSPLERAELTLVQRTDEDFIAGLLADLATEDGRRAVAKATPEAAQDGVLELFQPVHRTFHLALVELFCKEPGLPRLDPRKIESSGLVVRRVAVPRANAKNETVIEAVHEAWLKSPDGTKAWQPLPDGTWDPDPARRRKPKAGNPEIDSRVHALLRGSLDDSEEHVTSLFTAPVSVCKAAGRTILYGLVPTASADTTVAPEATYTDADLDEIVPQYLKPPGKPDDEPATLPSDIRGKLLSRYDADRLEGRPFMTMLSLLTVAFGLFPRDSGAKPPEAGKKLLAALDRTTIGSEVLGSQFLARAARALVWRTNDQVQMPDAWPRIEADVAREIRDGMRPVLMEQAKRIVPHEGRFEIPRARYVARAFVRVRRDDGCPPVILWSEPTKPFRIRPWHAAGPLPPLRVTLPDIVPDKLKDVQPNVTFVVPKGLAGFLNSNTAKALLKGSGSQGSSALGWICGFNIPIITICAFIVLTIFLSLLNIVFWWLPFVKICIPFPSSLAKRLEER